MKRILLSAVLLLACGAVQAQFNIRVYNMSEVLMMYFPPCRSIDEFIQAIDNYLNGEL